MTATVRQKIRTMAFTREHAYETLASLRPARIFLDSYRKRELPEFLDTHFGPPEEFFIAPDTQAAYEKDQLVPLLDDGNFGLVLFLDSRDRSLVQIYIESPHANRTFFRHWQQYLADLMVRIAEGEENDDRVRRIAALVGFQYVDSLFDYFARARELTGNAIRDARDSYPFSIPSPK
jgi:hypothetical protein